MAEVPFKLLTVQNQKKIVGKKSEESNGNLREIPRNYNIDISRFRKSRGGSYANWTKRDFPFI